MVVFGSLIVLIIISMVTLGVSGRMSSFHLRQSEIAFVKSEACLEEALIHLSRDNSYEGDTYTIDDLSCSVIVTANVDERTVTLDTEYGEFSHHFTVLVQVLPSFAILDFSY